MMNRQKKTLPCLLGSIFLVAGLGAATSVLAADTLIVNQYMKPSQHLSSANGEYRLTFQSDGNLVLQRQSDLAQIWTSNTANQNGKRLVLGSDGNLTVQSHSKSPAWTSNTGGSRVNRLKVNNDGNVVMYDTANKQIWSTDTSTASVTALATRVSHIGTTVNKQSSGSTMTIRRSASTLIGDLLILVTQTATAQIPTTAPAGWTRLGSCGVNNNDSTSCSATDGADLGAAIFYAFAGVDGAQTYTVSKANNQFTAASIMVLRNTATGNPFLNISSTSTAKYKVTLDNGKDEQNTCPSIAGTTDGHAVCVFVHDDAQPLTFPAGWTSRNRVIESDSALELVSRGLDSNSNTGGVTGTYNGQDPLNQMGNGIMFAFVVKPKP